MHMLYKKVQSLPANASCKVMQRWQPRSDCNCCNFHALQLDSTTKLYNATGIAINLSINTFAKSTHISTIFNVLI